MRSKLFIAVHANAIASVLLCPRNAAQVVIMLVDPGFPILSPDL